METQDKFYPYPETDTYISSAVDHMITLLDQHGFYPDERLPVLTAVQLHRQGKIQNYTDYKGLTRRRGTMKQLTSEELEKICRKTDELLKDTRMLDAWEQLFFASKSGRGDHAVLCGTVYEKFLEAAAPHRELIVVDAPPDLIRKMYGDSGLRECSVVFCMSDPRVRDFCRTLQGYQKFSYITLEELASKENVQAYLICAQWMNSEELNTALLTVSGIRKADSAVLLFLPDILADRKEKRMAAGEALDSQGVRSLMHFKRSCFTAVKRSHVLLELVRKEDSPESMDAWNCDCVLMDKEKKMQCVALSAISREAWEGRTGSLYQLLTPPKKVSQQKDENDPAFTTVEFCKEFTGRLFVEKKAAGKFYALLRVYLAPNDRQMRENKNGLGTKIAEASAKSLYDSEEIAIDMAYDILLTSREIQTGISLAMKKVKKQSLFYFWYSMKARRADSKDVLRCLFCEDPVLRSTAAALTYQSTEEDLRAVHQLAKTKKSEGFADEVLKRLSDLYLYAMEKGACEQNPCVKLCKEIREQKRKLAQFRDAMILKTFEDEQIQKLNTIISDDFWTDDYGLAIGAELRLFAGMDPGEICALTWDSIITQKVSGQKGRCLQIVNITRVCDRSKRTAHPIENRTRQRAIGLCSKLGEDLDEWMAYQKSEGIFDPKGRIVQARHQDHYSNCRPSDLVKYCKSLEEKVKIPGMMLSVPTGDGQSKLVNINESRSDLWNMTFRFECRYEGEMPIEDLRAYVGLRLQTTDGRHYTDYKNPNRCLAQSISIDRWVTRILNPKVPSPGIPKTELHDQKKFKIDLSAGTEAKVISFETPQDGPEARMTLELWCPHGANFTLQRLDEQEEKESGENEST